MRGVLVQIMGSRGRASRAVYNGKDLSGPGLETDPIVGEAVEAWRAGGCRNDMPVTVELHGIAPAEAEAEPAQPGTLQDGAEAHAEQAAPEVETAEESPVDEGEGGAEGEAAA